MSITSKTRKVLWARSGNECAYCHRLLIMQETADSGPTVVGDECHIASASRQGPRHIPSLTREQVDAYPNLILLCKVHHTMVDDRVAEFTVPVLKKMKARHETRVAKKEGKKGSSPPPPRKLPRINTGKGLLAIAVDYYALNFDHSEPANEQEADLIGSVAGHLSDLNMAHDLIESAERVKIGFELTDLIREVESTGFTVFGALVPQDVVIDGESHQWPVAFVRVIRNTEVVPG